MNQVRAELHVRAQLEPSLCSRVYGIEWGEDIYPVACRRRAYILIRLRDKISREKTWDFVMHMTAKKTRDWLQKSRVLKPKHMTVNLETYVSRRVLSVSFSPVNPFLVSLARPILQTQLNLSRSWTGWRAQAVQLTGHVHGMDRTGIAVVSSVSRGPVHFLNWTGRQQISKYLVIFFLHKNYASMCSGW
jgi:hypothetical protein